MGTKQKAPTPDPTPTPAPEPTPDQVRRAFDLLDEYVRRVRPQARNTTSSTVTSSTVSISHPSPEDQAVADAMRIADAALQAVGERRWNELPRTDSTTSTATGWSPSRSRWERAMADRLAVGPKAATPEQVQKRLETTSTAKRSEPKGETVTPAPVEPKGDPSVSKLREVPEPPEGKRGSLQEFADYLHISHKTLYLWRDAKKVRDLYPELSERVPSAKAHRGHMIDFHRAWRVLCDLKYIRPA